MERRSEFTTDATGEPMLAGDKLQPDTTYVAEPKRHRIANRLDRQQLACRVDDWVMADLETMLRGIDSRQAGQGEGNFLLLAGCLVALEYFATIYAGEHISAKARVKQFAERFLGDEYRDCWNVLWPAARNGILHGFWPSRVRTKSGEEYRFGVGCEPDMPHLKLAWRDGIPTDEVALCVNARQMLLDLKAAVTGDNGFQHWLREEANGAAIERGQPFIINDIANNALQSWRS